MAACVKRRRSRSLSSVEEESLIQEAVDEFWGEPSGKNLDVPTDRLDRAIRLAIKRGRILPNDSGMLCRFVLRGRGFDGKPVYQLNRTRFGEWKSPNGKDDNDNDNDNDDDNDNGEGEYGDSREKDDGEGEYGDSREKDDGEGNYPRHRLRDCGNYSGHRDGAASYDRLPNRGRRPVEEEPMRNAVEFAILPLVLFVSSAAFFLVSSASQESLAAFASVLILIWMASVLLVGVTTFILFVVDPIGRTMRFLRWLRFKAFTSTLSSAPPPMENGEIKKLCGESTGEGDQL